MYSSDDEEPSEDDGSTDEDIRELRSKQEASAGPSDFALSNGGGLGLKNDTHGDSLTFRAVYGAGFLRDASLLSRQSEQ